MPLKSAPHLCSSYSHFPAGPFLWPFSPTPHDPQNSLPENTIKWGYSFLQLPDVLTGEGLSMLHKVHQTQPSLTHLGSSFATAPFLKRLLPKHAVPFPTSHSLHWWCSSHFCPSEKVLPILEVSTPVFPLQKHLLSLPCFPKYFAHANHKALTQRWTAGQRWCLLPKDGNTQVLVISSKCPWAEWLNASPKQEKWTFQDS